MRSVIMQYRHKDLFHLDELTMYSDVSPTGVSSAMYHATRQDASLKRMTVLMCCNASGTEKSPLLICGTYPALLTDEDYLYIHSEDASISDDLLGEWLSRLNDHMSRGERKILLLLHRNRVGAFQGLELSNVRHVFFPENFPSVLRPLKRDVFHFVKMIYRSKYVQGRLLSRLSVVTDIHSYSWSGLRSFMDLFSFLEKFPSSHLEHFLKPEQIH